MIKMKVMRDNNIVLVQLAPGQFCLSRDVSMSEGITFCTKPVDKRGASITPGIQANARIGPLRNDANPNIFIDPGIPPFLEDPSVMGDKRI